MQKPQFKFYATLLDSFQYYLTSESETAFQEFIDKLNRVPFTSEAADKGTAFNELVDALAAGKFQELNRANIVTENIVRKKEVYDYRFTSREGIEYIFSFPRDIVNQFVEAYQFAIPQVSVKGILPTAYGPVELYGYLDEVERDMTSDIKTTKSYTFPKYLANYQHLVYPYCLNYQGIRIDRFRYHITDFSNVYEEIYQFKPERDTERLRKACEHLIQFLNNYRHLITDKKLFAQDEQTVQVA